MATVYKCKNGSCKHMVDLRCTLDEIERLEKELQYDHGAANYCKEMQEYRTAILSLGIDFFRDETGTLLDAVEMGGRLRGLFGKLQEKVERLEKENKELEVLTDPEICKDCLSDHDKAIQQARTEAALRCIEIVQTEPWNGSFATLSDHEDAIISSIQHHFNIKDKL